MKATRVFIHENGRKLYGTITETTDTEYVIMWDDGEETRELIAEFDPDGLDEYGGPPMSNNPDVSEKIGITLIALREQRGMTQAQLARAAQVTPVELCRFESGERTPNLAMLCKLAGGLGMKASEVLAEAGIRTSNYRP